MILDIMTSKQEMKESAVMDEEDKDDDVVQDNDNDKNNLLKFQMFVERRSLVFYNLANNIY